LADAVLTRVDVLEDALDTLAAPLAVDGTALGVLHVVTVDPFIWTDHDLDPFAVLADVAAGYVTLTRTESVVVAPAS
jgi:hypothetical protein